MKDEDALIGFGLFLIGLTLFLLVAPIAGLLWFALSFAIYEHRRQLYQKDSEEIIEQEMDVLGASLPIDDVLRATYGAGVELPEEGFGNSVDWFQATILGQGL